FQPFMFGQKALAPRMAIQLDIPLVFYGENESEYGNPISDTNTSLRHASYHSTNSPSDLFFGGTSISDLKRYFGLDDKDLLPYLPANKDTLFEKKVEVHYLGYYLKWHPQSCYYYSVEHGGFEASPERTPGTYSKYNSIDDRVDDFHYHTTGIKFGIGRASYDASQEIRSGDITRDEGISLVKRFDHEFPERFANEIFNYLSINPAEYPKAHKMFEEPIMNLEYYMALADTFRSPHIWKWENEMWKLRKNLT
ncbi:MAG: N-acetyl sugar amidotransferase, partial [Methylococcaceae bacterium]